MGNMSVQGGQGTGVPEGDPNVRAAGVPGGETKEHERSDIEKTTAEHVTSSRKAAKPQIPEAQRIPSGRNEHKGAPRTDRVGKPLQTKGKEEILTRRGDCCLSKEQ